MPMLPSFELRLSLRPETVDLLRDVGHWMAEQLADDAAARAAGEPMEEMLAAYGAFPAQLHDQVDERVIAALRDRVDAVCEQIARAGADWRPDGVGDVLAARALLVDADENLRATWECGEDEQTIEIIDELAEDLMCLHTLWVLGPCPQLAVGDEADDLADFDLAGAL